MGMKYRPEIDGLRALAVLPVILFHSGFDFFRGGFIGVDVFFVISGYLITTIILAELEVGKFSIVQFYERRARRILPALFFVVTICIFLSYFFLLPTDMKEFSESVGAVALFSSNILFWRQNNYFGAQSELKPLLHTWSLGVEEQFYLFFPLLLLLSWRFGKRFTVKLLIFIGCISLIAAHLGSDRNPVPTFFLLPTRAWELAIGSLIAFYFSWNNRPSHSTSQREWLSLFGLLLIVLSIFLFDEKTPFPSFYSLMPTLGTGLIILFATPRTYVGRLLGNKVLVGIGLISYSAYLWHQPLFAFARQYSLFDPSPLVFLGLSVLAILLAYLTWLFVEQPFRQKKMIKRDMVFAFAFAGSAILVCFASFGHFTRGYMMRPNFEAKFFQLENVMNGNRGLSPLCDKFFTLAPECRTSDEPEILLWGDSYAMHLVDGLKASNPEVKVVQMTVSTCGPVLDVAPVNHIYKKPWAERCIESNDKVFEYMKKTKSLKYVLLSSSFSQYVGEEWMLMRRDGVLMSNEENFEKYFQATLEKIKSLGLKPIVFSPTPKGKKDIGKCVRKAIQLSRDISLCDLDQKNDVGQEERTALDILHQIESEANVVWLADGICRQGKCQARIGDTIIYRDNGHLTHEGSAFLGRTMDFHTLITKQRKRD